MLSIVYNYHNMSQNETNDLSEDDEMNEDNTVNVVENTTNTDNEWVIRRYVGRPGQFWECQKFW